jgi:uncharacterized caspase-like protein
MGLVRRRLTMALPLIICCFGAIAAMESAHAATRIALVVGNSKYQNVHRLTNPANDALLIAKTLRGLGFTLVGGGPQLDLDKPAFDRAVQDFGNAAQGADVALFYYAGHGLQVNGENYLVPVDADPHKEADLDFQMLGADLVLRQLASAGTRLSIVILDACRNNPFGGRGLRALGGGLAQMQAPKGTLISFSTQPGNVALDGKGGHSPFSRALADVMRRPGLDIFRAFNEVGLIVSKATKGAQQPWVSASPINGDFYFAGTAKPNHLEEQQRSRYAAAARVDTKQAWDSFLRDYKTGYFADLARAERDKLVTEEQAKAAADALAKERAHKQAQAAAARQAAEKIAEQKEKAAALEQARRDLEARETLEKLANQAAEKAARLAAEQAAEKIAAQVAARSRNDQQQKMAALTPPSGESGPSTSPLLTPTDLVRLLKLHLRQVGCDPGDDTGEWDASARRALTQFNRYAGTHLDVSTPNRNALDAIRGKNGRICPLVCGPGTRRDGDRCIAITCKAGYVLGSNGICQKRPHPSKTTAHAHPKHTSAPHQGSVGIVRGGPEHMRLRSACRSNEIDACRKLCAAGTWAWKACRKVQRLSGLGGWGHGGGGGHHNRGQFSNSGYR